ncbi:MAG: hypothetical protein Q7U57_08200 [Methylovulum sp.]|nr:hypothetical protein [Methylovulum sp.]
MKQSEQDVNKPAAKKSKRPEDWSPEERLAALQQSYSLLGEGLNTWCRERGVFIHQLKVETLGSRGLVFNSFKVEHRVIF